MSKFNLEIISRNITLLTKNKEPLNSYVQFLKNGTARLSPNHRLENTIPSDKGGIYCFWWTGDKEFFRKTINRKIPVKGPGGVTVNLEIDDNWIDSYGTKDICLYVGKNNSSIKKRIGQHLRLNKKRDTNTGLNSTVLTNRAITTSCQLKNGIEKLFLDTEDVRDLMLENISLSYVVMDGKSQAVNRFYLEDKAIGEYYPILNMDIER